MAFTESSRVISSSMCSSSLSVATIAAVPLSFCSHGYISIVHRISCRYRVALTASALLVCCCLWLHLQEMEKVFNLVCLYNARCAQPSQLRQRGFCEKCRKVMDKLQQIGKGRNEGEREREKARESYKQQWVIKRNPNKYRHLNRLISFFHFISKLLAQLKCMLSPTPSHLFQLLSWYTNVYILVEACWKRAQLALRIFNKKRIFYATAYFTSISIPISF